MKLELVDRLVREGCPFGKTTCFIALMGGCSVVRNLLLDHRADYAPPVFKGNYAEIRMEASKRGGRKTADAKRKLEFVS